MRLLSSEVLLLGSLLLLAAPAHAGGEPCTPGAIALGMCTEDGKQRFNIPEEDMELVRRLAAEAEEKEEQDASTTGAGSPRLQVGPPSTDGAEPAPRPPPPPAPLRGIRVELPGDEAPPGALDDLKLERKAAPGASSGVGDLELRRKDPAASTRPTVGTRPTTALPTVGQPATSTPHPVPVPQPERTWAGWADETASAVWTAIFGD